MSAATTRPEQGWSKPEARPTTLLALVRVVAETTEDDREVVAAVLHLLRSGEVRLCGNFRNAPIEDLE